MFRVDTIAGDDLAAFVDIVANAYPGVNIASAEEKQRWRERVEADLQDNPSVRLQGVWRDGQLQGGMRLFDFTMRMFETAIEVGGVGLVAVDLLHKKEKVAKELITAFLRYYRDRNATMVSLYAFRHDFYRKMGFGYGTKMNQYRLRPGNLPGGASKSHMVYLTPADAKPLHACYRRLFERTHGLFDRPPRTFEQILANQELRAVGFRRDGQIHGYLLFNFKPTKPGAENMLLNDIHIQELLYEDGEALGEMISFLQSQADQIDTIWLNTQDEAFHFLPIDARNGTGNFFSLNHETNIQALGIMYRVIDVPGIFKLLRDHDFNGQTIRLKLTIADTFFPQNDGATLLDVRDGAAAVVGDGSWDAEVSMDIAEFSSLLVGAVRFKRLLDYGLARISDPAAAGAVERLFRADEQPVCVTRF